MQEQAALPYIGQHVIYALTADESRKYGLEMAPARVIWVHDEDSTVNLQVNIYQQEPLYVRKAVRGNEQGNWR